MPSGLKMSIEFGHFPIFSKSYFVKSHLFLGKPVAERGDGKGVVRDRCPEEGLHVLEKIDTTVAKVGLLLHLR
jgi:hypothetical protein